MSIRIRWYFCNQLHFFYLLVSKWHFFLLSFKKRKKKSSTFQHSLQHFASYKRWHPITLINAGFRTLISFSPVLAAKAAAPAAGSLIYCSRLHFRSHSFLNPFLSGWEDKCSLGSEKPGGVCGWEWSRISHSLGEVWYRGGLSPLVPFNKIAEHLWLWL